MVDYGAKNAAVNKMDVEWKEKKTIENDHMPKQVFIEFLTDSFRLMKEKLKNGGAFYIFHASMTTDQFQIAMQEALLQTRQVIIWVKNRLVLSRQDYQWKHEPILYGWKEGAAHYFLDDRTKTTVYEQEKPDLDKLKKEELKTLLEQIYAAPNTIIYEDRPTRSDEHPTMKPIKLLAHLIQNSSSRNQIVLDQFGGSGSTLITCEQLGRTCYMMELDPKFVDVIIKRWEIATGQKAEKVGSADAA